MQSTTIDLFLDLCLPEGSAQSTVATLGPAGTSSETAARRLTSHMAAGASLRADESSSTTVLHDSYEDAANAVRNGSARFLVAANAYSNIAEFYMDPDLRLVGAFVHETPQYGIAVVDVEAVPAELRVATHPAPTPLILQLLPVGMRAREVVAASSTSMAAHAARSGAVDAALTTGPAAELYGLTFISKTRTIKMLWSVFCSAADIELPGPGVLLGESDLFGDTSRGKQPRPDLLSPAARVGA